MSNLIVDEPQTNNSVFLRDVSVHYRLPNENIGTFKEYVIKLI